MSFFPVFNVFFRSLKADPDLTSYYSPFSKALFQTKVLQIDAETTLKSTLAVLHLDATNLREKLGFAFHNKHQVQQRHLQLQTKAPRRNRKDQFAGFFFSFQEVKTVR